MLGTPRWEIIGDAVRLLWSNGFAATTIGLRRAGGHFEGWAEASSDAIPRGKPNWPQQPSHVRIASCTLADSEL
jgi:hypothetical protein